MPSMECLRLLRAHSSPLEGCKCSHHGPTQQQFYLLIFLRKRLKEIPGPVVSVTTRVGERREGDCGDGGLRENETRR